MSKNLKKSRQIEQSGPESRTKYLRVRFSERELSQIKKSAKQSGKPYMADWVRDRLGLEPTGYGKG
jgi:hypothetical protein